MRQRFIKSVSAPNISGTSVSSVEPPRAASQSEKRPTSGLAVRPEKPSDPPHLRPTTSSETGTSTRSFGRAASSSAMSSSPRAYSSPGSCARMKRMLRPETSPSRSLNDSSVLFSQPSDTTNTPPALGWRQSRASRLAVVSWSCPSCEQP